MLAYRLRRWPNIEPALRQCPVFAGVMWAPDVAYVDTEVPDQRARQYYKS